VGPDKLGRYELLFELARGGMATVFVGRLLGAHGFDRLVAIKRLIATGASQDEVADFLDEARLTARINHPSIVPTLELGEHAGEPFIVMQLIQGVSLAQLLAVVCKNEAGLDPYLTAWIVARAAAALHAAHELRSDLGEPYGLVHRDISPENILLSFEGQVFVADFGVAKFTGAERLTQSGVVKGKFAYMSPEQTEAAVLDRRSDVFSLGIVLHECLAGERLFAGGSMADTIRRVNELSPPDPREQRPEIPDRIVEIAMGCLAKDRNERTETAGALATELRSFMREGPRVDDVDLAALLEAHCGEQRDGLRERIHAAVTTRRHAKSDGEIGHAATVRADSEAADPHKTRKAGTPSDSPPSDEPSSGQPQLQLTARATTTDNPPPTAPNKRLATALVALLGAAGLIAALLLTRNRLDDQQPTEPAGPQPSAQQASSTPNPVATPTQMSSLPALSATAATASASASPATSQPTAAATNNPPRPAPTSSVPTSSATVTTTSSPSASAKTPASASAGTPFRELGD